MNILCATDSSAVQWDNFVQNYPHSTNYHRWHWKRIIENNFGWQSLPLMVEENGHLRGILPLFFQNSRLLGRWVSSVPLFQSGGILADTPEAASALLHEACALTQRLSAKYLELRQSVPQIDGLTVRGDRVKAILTVQANPQEMLQSLDSRVRTSIRKAERSALTVHFGAADLLDEFYSVFARNMRDLGTPVYHKRFFADILTAFPNESFIAVVRSAGKSVACDFLLGYRRAMESAWAASIREFLPLKPNMLLHWKAFCFAAEHGYSIFDFGRSIAGSGPHRYKMQWGSQEIPLPWSYWSSQKQQVQALNRHNPKLQLAISAWRNLPLAIANRVGPVLVKHLPS
jgi:FemAB-related protein (PEP-CTERM system-associated)